MKELYEQARKEIPYSDTEIRDLYVKAVRIGNSKLKSKKKLIFELVILPGIIGLASLSIAQQVGAIFAGMFFLIAFATALVISITANADALRDTFRSQEVDVFDPEVLAVVAKYISSEPLRNADELRESIKESRAKIEKSVKLLPTIISHLNKEAQISVDDSVKLLVESKMTAAESALVRLTKADEDLLAQSREAKLAVAPVREMVAKLERISSLSASLASIQDAHGLATEAEEAVSQHAIELKLLRAVSQNAMARLTDIQRRYEADSTARVELEHALKTPETEESRLEH